MKKIIYALIISLVVVSGLVFIFAPSAYGSSANREIKEEIPKKSIPKPHSAAENNAELKKWEASPDGVQLKKWKASPAGRKVLDDITKISKSVRDFTNMEGTVTALSLPPGSRLGFGIIVNINGEDYILSFGSIKSNEYQQLHSLKVNDKIIIRSHSVSFAPKYYFSIISGDYVERDGKIIYKRVPNKGGC